VAPRPSKILRLGWWEVSHSAGGLDKRSLGVTVVALALVGLAAPFIADGGLYDGIYVVGVDEDNPYHGAVEESDRLRTAEPSWSAFRVGNVDVLINDDVHVADNQRGEAALSELRGASRRYNRETLSEVSEDAAFPVNVEVRYVDRTTETGFEDGGGSEGETDDGASSREGSGGESGSDEGGEETDDGGGGGGGGGVFGDLNRLLAGDGNVGSPANVRPPFPYESLILAFAFIVPLNFVVQAYSTSIMDERIGRRGSLLLVSPVTRTEIVAGKTLPYFVAALAVTSGVALFVGGSFVSVAAVAPVALAFLALSFVGAMFARSYKELTFVTVFVSVVVTCYVFVPAVFTDVDPIASISPLSVVVLDLQDEAVSATRYLFSTTPLYLSSGVLFLLGAGVYRDEDMFAQRALRHKALDSMVALLHQRASVAKVVILFIPFVFALQMLALATLFALPIGISLPLLLVVVSVVEEVAKSIAVYAGFANSVYERTTANALVLGAFGGLGFFLGEKLTLVAQVVGIQRLELGSAVLGTGFEVSPVVAGGLLVAPLALHVVTTCISSLGARYGKQEYVTGLCLAIIVHTAYNLGVVSVVA